MEDPKRTPWQCIASVCVAGVLSALLGDLLGVSRFKDRDLLYLLIYPRIFLCVFIVYRFLVGFFCVVVFYYMFMCVSCFLVLLSLLAK